MSRGTTLQGEWRIVWRITMRTQIKKLGKGGGVGKSDDESWNYVTEKVTRERGRLELFTASLNSRGFFSSRKEGSSSFQALVSRGTKLHSQYAGVRRRGTLGTLGRTKHGRCCELAREGRESTGIRCGQRCSTAGGAYPWTMRWKLQRAATPLRWEREGRSFPHTPMSRVALRCTESRRPSSEAVLPIQMGLQYSMVERTWDLYKKATVLLLSTCRARRMMPRACLPFL